MQCDLHFCQLRRADEGKCKPEERVFEEVIIRLVQEIEVRKERSEVRMGLSDSESTN